MNERKTQQEMYFCLGGLRVRVQCDDPGLVLAACGPIRSFLSEGGVSDVVIGTRRARIAADPHREAVFDSGGVWRLYRSESHHTYRFFVPDHGDTPVQEARFSLDFCSGDVVFEERLFPRGSHVAPFGHPVDELLVASYLALRGGALVHACGVHHPEVGGVLFCGFSGAGKTTTARLWDVREGVTVLSDDRIVVRTGAGKPRMYGTPWHGEAALSQSSDCDLAALLVLEHGSSNRLTPLSPAEAVAALVARGFPPYHSSGLLMGVLTTLTEVVSQTPCYRFEFEPDQRAVDAVLKLLGGSGRE